MQARPEEETRRIATDAPWRWLGEGWRDMMRAPVVSIGYGLAIVGGGVAINALLWRAGLSSWIPVMLGVFALLGPVIAVGLYEVSRRLEQGEQPGLGALFAVKMKSPTQILLVGFFLMFAVFAWVRIASLLYALFASANYQPLDDFLAFSLTTPGGIAMLMIGTLFGGAIAFCIYLLTFVSIPMLMDRDTDAFTAIATGIKAVKKNPGAMLLWAWLIAIFTAAGVGTLFIGLALIFPLLGHATWHAYREIAPR